MNYTEFRTEIRDILAEKVEQVLQGATQEIVNEGARFKLTNRIRRNAKNQVQRRKKVSTRKGFTINRKGKSVKIPPAERRKRSRAQRRGAKKRKAKQFRSLKRRTKSIKKRNRLFGKR